ncbi:MAG TPA: hypothetical protein VK588_08700 [Chitinophagaceae bacterium]|nr:hypothetical protein [Chitinophagaceae bacterium]
MSDKDQLYVALLVIRLGGTFSNTYGLCRLLSRKFEIFKCQEVVVGLINHQYVVFDELAGVKQFTINGKGEEVLMQNRQRIIDILRTTFPSELNLIDKL